MALDPKLVISEDLGNYRYRVVQWATVPSALVGSFPSVTGTAWGGAEATLGASAASVLTASLVAGTVIEDVREVLIGPLDDAESMLGVLQGNFQSRVTAATGITLAVGMGLDSSDVLGQVEEA